MLVGIRRQVQCLKLKMKSKSDHTSETASQNQADRQARQPEGLALEAPELLQTLPIIQAQLTIGAPDDPLEREADVMADQVSRSLPAPDTNHTISQLSDEERLLRKESAATAISPASTAIKSGITASPSLSQQLQHKQGGGHPLAHHTRAEMEAVFGADFGQVRLHTDRQASQMNQQINARAFTHGSDIYFNSGQYNPNSTVGKSLLGHELTHVVQQGRTSSFIQRTDDQPESTPTQAPSGPPEGAIYVSISRITMIPPAGATFTAGPARPQAFAIVLRLLLRDQYRRGLENDVIDFFFNNPEAEQVYEGQRAFSDTYQAEAGEEINPLYISISPAYYLITYLRGRGLEIHLTDSQMGLIRLGFANLQLFNEIKNRLYPWYSQAIFDRQMAQRAGLLRRYNELRDNFELSSSSADKEATINEIVESLRESADIAEVIRRNFNLGNLRERANLNRLQNEERLYASIAYRKIWNLEINTEDIASAPTTMEPFSGSLFLSYVLSQPTYSEQALESSHRGNRARQLLLARFFRYLGRISVQSGLEADQRLIDNPGRFNEPPFNAQMSVFPALGLLNKAARGGEYRFSMRLFFRDVFEHFLSYSFLWERVQLPETNMSTPEPDRPEDRTPIATDTPGLGELASERFGRTTRYNQEDFQRIQDELNAPPGTAIIDLVVANAVINYVGTGIRLGFDVLTTPHHEQIVVFDEPGLYMIRCKAVPVLDGDEELVRPPSVAYLLLQVAEPDEVARESLELTIDTQEAFNEAALDIQRQLGREFSLPGDGTLHTQLTMLQDATATPEQRLNNQQTYLLGEIARINDEHHRIENEIDALRQQPDSAENRERIRRLESRLYIRRLNDRRTLSSLRSQLSNVENLIETRDSRRAEIVGTHGSQYNQWQQLLATFQNDDGSSIQLALEMIDLGRQGTQYRVFISDLTTDTSGQAEGQGNNRRSAVADGIQKLLETSSEYGRGRVAVNIDGTIEVVPIQAGVGRILSQSVDNAVLVASLAAIVAAPFTGGASLYLLIPLGVVGAGPSIYRLYERASAETWRWTDANIIMDLINIVGAALGVGLAAAELRIAAGGAQYAGRAITVRNVMLLTGLGTDGTNIILLGGQTVSQIRAIANDPNIPEGEKRSRIARVLANGFLQLGMMAAGEAASRFQVAGSGSQGRTGRPDADGSPAPVHVDGDTSPGRVPPVEADAPTTPARQRPEDIPGRAQEGNAAPRIDPATPPEVSSAPPNSPEHLFDLLSRGIDRNSPPPRQGDGTTTIQEGVFRRGIDDAQTAYRAYNEALVATGQQVEVAIYHRSDTGEFIIVIGNETEVRLHGERSARALVHFHPNPTHAHRLRLPASADFADLITMAFQGDAVLVREFIEYDIPGVGRGRTEYGIELGHDQPFYIKMARPDGTEQTLRFTHDGEYEAHLGRDTIVIPEGSPQYEALIRDIHDYLRNREGLEPLGPSAGQRTSLGSGRSGADPFSNLPLPDQVRGGLRRSFFRMVSERRMNAIDRRAAAQRASDVFQQLPGLLQVLDMNMTQLTDYILAQNNPHRALEMLINADSLDTYLSQLHTLLTTQGTPQVGSGLLQYIQQFIADPTSANQILSYIRGETDTLPTHMPDHLRGHLQSESSQRRRAVLGALNEQSSAEGVRIILRDLPQREAVFESAIPTELIARLGQEDPQLNRIFQELQGQPEHLQILMEYITDTNQIPDWANIATRVTRGDITAAQLRSMLGYFNNPANLVALFTMINSPEAIHILLSHFDPPNLVDTLRNFTRGRETGRQMPEAQVEGLLRILDLAPNASEQQLGQLLLLRDTQLAARLLEHPKINGDYAALAELSSRFERFAPTSDRPGANRRANRIENQTAQRNILEHLLFYADNPQQLLRMLDVIPNPNRLVRLLHLSSFLGGNNPNFQAFNQQLKNNPSGLNLATIPTIEQALLTAFVSQQFVPGQSALVPYRADSDLTAAVVSVTPDLSHPEGGMARFELERAPNSENPTFLDQQISFGRIYELYLQGRLRPRSRQEQLRNQAVPASYNNPSSSEYGILSKLVAQLFGQVFDPRSQGAVDPLLLDSSSNHAPVANYHADHIVPFNRIIQMAGFDQLTLAQQRAVVQWIENFALISDAANTSRGDSSYASWQLGSELSNRGLQINEPNRQRIGQLEQILEARIQQIISDMVVSGNGNIHPDLL